MLSSGFPARQPRPTLDPRAWTTRNHGEQNTCVGPVVPRSMTWPGLRMPCTSSSAAWTTLPESTTLIQVSITSIARLLHDSQGSTANSISRHSRAANRRAQPLRSGRDLGSSERIHRDTIFRPIRPHLLSQDQGRPIYTWVRRQSPQARQPYQSRPAPEKNLLKQPCSPRIWASFAALRHGHCSFDWLSCSLDSRHPNIDGTCHEPSQRCQP